MMRPSLPVLVSLLLTTTFFSIAHTANSSYMPAAPAPIETTASPPPPPAPIQTAASAPATPPPPAWTAVANVNDKTTQQVGQFAVPIYALTKRRQLVFVNVVSGRSQPWNGGYNYQLVITAAGPGTKVAQYDALVWGILGTTSWKLMSFTPK